MNLITSRGKRINNVNVDYALKWGNEKADHNQEVCKASLISVPKSHSIAKEKADTKYNDSMQK